MLCVHKKSSRQTAVILSSHLNTIFSTHLALCIKINSVTHLLKVTPEGPSTVPRGVIPTLLPCHHCFSSQTAKLGAQWWSPRQIPFCRKCTLQASPPAIRVLHITCLIQPGCVYLDLVAASQGLKGVYKTAGDGPFTRAWSDRQGRMALNWKKWDLD